MGCEVIVVITRMGRGDLWRHETFDAADEHPLTQYGDAIIGSGKDVERLYNRLELSDLARRLGLTSLAEDVDKEFAKPRPLLESYCELIWKTLQREAKPVPKDPKEICNLIVSDRQTTKAPEFNKMARKKKEAAETTETPVAKKRGGKSKYHDSQVVTLLADKEGKQYGGENNPKRNASAARFACYRDGITIGELKTALVDALGPEGADKLSDDLAWDVKRGFISLSPAPAVAAEDETAEAA